VITENRLRPGWVLGPCRDLLIFTGPVVAIVGCDVSHVWATGYRVYFDSERFRRRPGLFIGIPLACFGAGVLLYSGSSLLFWRVLAYLAAFHFVRQQWGWVAWSRRSAGEGRGWELHLDQVAIYNATLFPLLFWHANLPRTFTWFVPGDFAPGLEPTIYTIGLWLHWTINALYIGHQLRRWITGRGVNIAKLQIWATTWFAWYGGIIIFNSDWAFTTLNVLTHAVPYLVVVHHVEQRQRAHDKGFLALLFQPRAFALYLGLLIVIGFTEEWLWDRLVWHDNPTLFPGDGVAIGTLGLTLLVPLLAVPQATHYLLDGWIWKFRKHPELSTLVEKH